MPVLPLEHSRLLASSLDRHYKICKTKVCIVFRCVTVQCSPAWEINFETMEDFSSLIGERDHVAKGNIVKVHAHCYRRIPDSMRYALWGPDAEVTGPITKEYHNVYQFMVPIPAYAFEKCCKCQGELLMQFQPANCPYCACK